MGTISCDNQAKQTRKKVVQFPGWQIFLVFTTSKVALGPNRPPIQCLPRALSLVKWLKPEAYFYSHLVLRLRMRQIIPSLNVFHTHTLNCNIQYNNKHNLVKFIYSILLNSNMICPLDVKKNTIKTYDNLLIYVIETVQCNG